MINKYRVHEVAKDFDIKSNIVVDLLSKHFDGQKKHMTALEEDELDLIFETFTKENEVDDLNDYFNFAPAPKKAKKEDAPAEEKAEEAPAAEVKEEEKKAEVYLKPEEVSLAIGKGGMNIKLASMLTEYTIDVYRELDESADDEDIYLDEFKDEIDEWVINAIKSIGLDTAKAVLNAPREMLIEKADLEEDTVDEVLNILSAEFEE